MSWEQQFMLKGLCLLTGYLLGSFLTAEIVARCVAGVGIRHIGDGSPTARNLARHLGKPAAFAAVAGDVLKTVLVCWFCYRLAAPELEHAAVLYGGLGAVWGHARPLWRRAWGGGTVAVVCTWLVLYLPITGALCCLAGLVVVAGTGRRALGAVLIGALAVPVSWLQFGSSAGGAMALAALLLVWEYRARLFRPGEGEEELTPHRRL